MILLCSLNHLITFFFIHCHWFLAKDVFSCICSCYCDLFMKFCRTCYNHRINIFIFHNVKIFFVKKIYSQLFCCILCHITYRITNCDDLTSWYTSCKIMPMYHTCTTRTNQTNLYFILHVEPSPFLFLIIIFFNNCYSCTCS